MREKEEKNAYVVVVAEGHGENESRSVAKANNGTKSLGNQFSHRLNNAAAAAESIRGNEGLRKKRETRKRNRNETPPYRLSGADARHTRRTTCVISEGREGGTERGGQISGDVRGGHTGRQPTRQLQLIRIPSPIISHSSHRSVSKSPPHRFKCSKKTGLARKCSGMWNTDLRSLRCTSLCRAGVNEAFFATRFGSKSQ